MHDRRTLEKDRREKTETIIKKYAVNNVVSLTVRRLVHATFLA